MKRMLFLVGVIVAAVSPKCRSRPGSAAEHVDGTSHA